MAFWSVEHNPDGLPDGQFSPPKIKLWLLRTVTAGRIFDAVCPEREDPAWARAHGPPDESRIAPFVDAVRVDSALGSHRGLQRAGTGIDRAIGHGKAGPSRSLQVS